jgi:ATP-dependent exoDNAse (exonuclease V) alpha subunit
MALYSFSVKPISRLKGESIVKVASYQSRGKLHDEREDVSYDFSHKTDLAYTEIFLPSDAPTEFLDRQILWNAVDKSEKRYDARTGRAVIAALQNELPLDAQIKAIREFIIEAFVKQGMCADLAIHRGHRKDKSLMEGEHAKGSPNNPHLHILLTDRPIERKGFCAKKNRDWNKTVYVRQWRELWEKVQNKEFERNGLDIRVSHESLEIQGIDREPTKHLGRKTTEMKRRGKETNRDSENRAIEVRNNDRENRKHQRRLERDQERESELSR